MNTFRDFEHGAWEDAEVRLWHKADIDADDDACPLLGVKRTSLIPLTNVR